MFFWKEKEHHHATRQFKDMRSAVAAAAGLMGMSVKDAVCLSSKYSFNPSAPKSTLYDIVKKLSHSLHRVPIVDPKSHKLTNVVTQSTIVRLLNQNPDMMGDLATMTIADLGLGVEPVVTVGLEDRTIDAFKVIVDSKVSAVAVVDELGALTANLSLTDVRNLVNAEALKMLNAPVSQFIHFVHENELNIKYPSVAIKRSSTFKQVLSRMCSAQIHRVWVEDDEKRPVGVISMSDVMKCIAKHI
jgi:CBS-domain-containing membrane protein